MSWLGDERGQDIIEYGLVTAFVGVAGVLAWRGISQAIRAGYIGYDANTQGLWEPRNPL